MALRRWLVLGEETETAWCPEWYPLFLAADRCHAKPWEMVEQSVWWSDKALTALSAENWARDYLQSRGK